MTGTEQGADESSRQRIIDALGRVSNFMGEVTDPHRLLTLIMEESKQVMDSEASSCMLYDETTDELYFEVALGERGDEVKSIRLGRGQGFGGICLAEGRTLVVNDVASDERHFSQADEKSQFVTRNLVAAPMVYQGGTIGVLQVLNKTDGRDYDDTDVKVLEIVADQAAMAITNARLVEQSIQRERLAAIGIAVSGVAHHLKNIIQSVKGTVGLVRMGIENENVELIEKSLPVLQRGSDRMEQSVGEMLQYSKQREPDLEPGDLNDLASEVVGESRASADEKGVALRCQTDERVGEALLDKHRLHDTILNLVGNAVDAMDEAGTPDPTVTVRTALSHDGSKCVVEVEDNGLGIPANVLERIFDPFFSTKGSKGTGLGLAVAQKVAQENNGSLTVRSTLGEGTVFTLTLPVVPLP